MPLKFAGGRVNICLGVLLALMLPSSSIARPFRMATHTSYTLHHSTDPATDLRLACDHYLASPSRASVAPEDSAETISSDSLMYQSKPIFKARGRRWPLHYGIIPAVQRAADSSPASPSSTPTIKLIDVAAAQADDVHTRAPTTTSVSPEPPRQTISANASSSEAETGNATSSPLAGRSLQQPKVSLSDINVQVPGIAGVQVSLPPLPAQAGNGSNAGSAMPQVNVKIADLFPQG
jgi:hypothetical protein